MENCCFTKGTCSLPAFLTGLVCACILLPPAYADSSRTPLSLTQSMAIALENSTAIMAAGHAVTAAEYERKSAGTDFLPKFRTEYSYTRFKNEPVMKSPAGDIFPYPTKMTVGTKDRYQWSTHVTQPVFTGGALRSAYQLSKLDFEVAREHLDAAVQDTVLQVKEAYFSILKAEKTHMVATRAAEQVKSHLDIARAFFNQEMIPKNDLLEAEVRYAQARQDVITSGNRLEVTQAYFNTVLRRGIHEPVVLEDILEVPFDEFVLDDSLAEALRSRPEMKAAVLHYERARKGVSLARSDYFPRIALVAQYQRTGDSPDVSGSRYEASEVSMLYTVLSWDIFEWGRSSYQVNAGKARVLEAEAQLQHVSDSIALEVKHAWLSFSEAGKNIQVAQTAIEHAEEDLRLNHLLYEEQMATTTDVLDAQTRLTSAYRNYYNALSDCHLARSRLERAMGRRTASPHLSEPAAQLSSLRGCQNGVDMLHTNRARPRKDEPRAQKTLLAEK
jgi:outer membrane protein